jgi:flagellin-like hook-associated protein FlgL
MDFSVDATTDILTVTNGTYATGSTLQLSTTDTLPGGLSENTTYYVIRISDTQIQLATSLANARSGTAIDITDAGIGTQKLTQQALADNMRNVDHVTQILSQVGAYEERVTLQLKILNSHLEDTASDLEVEEALDLTKAAVELSSKQTAYEAALKSTVAMMNMSSSLVDMI